MRFEQYQPKFKQFLKGEISLKETLKGLPISISEKHLDSYWKGKTLVIGLDGWNSDKIYQLWRIMHELSHLAQAHRADWKTRNWGMDNLEYKCVEDALFREKQVAAFQLQWAKDWKLFRIQYKMDNISLELSDLGHGCQTLSTLASQTSIDYDNMMNLLNERLFDGIAKR